MEKPVLDGLDFQGDMSHYQRQLDTAGVDYDVSMLTGATKREIECVVGSLLLIASRKQVKQDATV